MPGGGAGSGGPGSGQPGSGNRGQGGYPPSGSGRPPRQQPPPSQPDRPISFQTEDRYWTDYLRVILPVVGLLLLLGLFWFWASSLIGDDDDTPATPSTMAVILTPEIPTPTVTTEAAISPAETTETDEGEGDATGDEGNGEGETEPTPTEEGEPVEATGGTFEVGDLVAVTDDGVNLRSEATTASEAVEQLGVGDQLRITGPPEEDEEYIWWPVEDEANDLTGWIAEDFLEPGE